MKKIKYLSPIDIKINKPKKYCFFKKNNIKYIDYKNPKFLIKFINEFGKILPRRVTGTSKKYQILLNKAIKRCRHLALLPFIGDELR
ncbi:MAG: 30S ribosomal protein S18 [Candidatus Shikimatogenerans bostrichidophilus]|nr:MAG: 30S ribosomal protein S18 [Candidatus Shikimatogenerans bostrichidophilus]